MVQLKVLKTTMPRYSSLKPNFQKGFTFLHSEKAERVLKLFLQKAKTSTGFTLSEVLIASAIIAIIGVSIMSTVALFLKFSADARGQIQAQNLAHQKIEFIRNMPYDDVATVAGAIYPPGNIPDNEDITVDNQVYKVQTLINYVDDPFDGDVGGTIVGKPVDIYPYDYKKISIKIRDKNNSKILAQTTTTMSAKAAETATNTGILSLRVQNSQGNPVAGAVVNVTNPTPVPPVNINTFTDVSGLVLIPSLPPSSNNEYHVTVSLSGYNSDSTNPAFAPNNLSPVKPDFNILAQQITPLTLEIDLVGSMQITARDTAGAVMTGLNLSVKGDKLTYASPDTYKFSQTAATDGSGVVNLSNLEWDSYSIAVPSGYYIVSSSPYQKVSVSAGQGINVSLVVTNNSNYPTVASTMPSAGVNNSTLDFNITGTNLVSGTTVLLRLAGQPDISATGVISASGDTELTGTFDLTGKQSGIWDLIVTDPSSRVVTQTGGFSISAP